MVVTDALAAVLREHHAKQRQSLWDSAEDGAWSMPYEYASGMVSSKELNYKYVNEIDLWKSSFIIVKIKKPKKKAQEKSSRKKA